MIHNKTELLIYLIRHAESEMNQKPELIAGRSPQSPLSEKGKIQSLNLGRKLNQEGIKFDAIYSSPLIRTKMTAELVLKEMKISKDMIIEVPELVEFSSGDWEGRSRQEIYTPEILQYINTKGSLFTPPNGESQLMVEHRASGWFIKEILHNPNYFDKTKTIAIFSHGLTIKCLLHFVMHFDDRLIYRIRLDNTAYCKLRLNREGWFIDSLNETSQLL
ncbi:MAG: histidine phosphatase family protein [Candidatus Roizmanbacteria bacterium]|nr:MAG: histidine phosphatase family protein [Candidatus Roizmanbacteria bacterium]